MNKVKNNDLLLVTINANLFQNQFKLAKIWWLFAQLYIVEIFARLWVDFKRESVLIASFITSAAWKQLQFTLNNSEAQQGNTKITQGDVCLSYQI